MVDLSTGIDSPAPQEVAVPTTRGLQLTAGLGVAFGPDYEGSVDHQHSGMDEGGGQCGTLTTREGQS